VIATGIPFKGRGDHATFLKEQEAVMKEVAGIRRFGAASLDLAYVAAGRFDAFWERDLSPWDIAAGLLLVKEAQGMVSDLSNGPNMLDSGTILAANDMLHPQLLKMIKAAGK